MSRHTQKTAPDLTPSPAWHSAPALIQMAVCLFAPPDIADALLGDLEEELSLLPLARRSRVAEFAWYVRQVTKSLVPLMKIRIARGELVASVALSQIAFVLPLLAIECLRSFLLSNIPLKDGAEMSSSFISMLVMLSAVFAMIGAFLLCSFRKSVDRLALLLFTAICLLYSSLGLLPLHSWKAGGTLLIVLLPAITAGAWLWRKVEPTQNLSGEEFQ